MEYEHGAIFFKLQEEPIYTGSTLTGSILVNAAKRFETKQLTLSLYGREEVNFEVVDQNIATKHTAAKDICLIHFEYKQLEHIDVGMYEYPFEMKVPEWLPASTMVSSKSSNASIWYEVRA